MKRRTCLQTLGLASGALMAPPMWGAHHRRVEKAGVQLFTVREEMAKDTVATLAAVAEIGYKEVETAGTGTLTPQQFAEALKKESLIAPAAHVPLNFIQEQPDEILNTAQLMGSRYVVVPWLPPQMRTKEGYALTIETLNTFGEQSAAEGIQTCYHNHDFEFKPLDGSIPFDVMLANCDANLVHFELDLYWTERAGVDTKAYLASNPRRFPLCHVKDRTASGDMTEVGAGVINFTELFAAGTGIRHFFVEHDRPANALASITSSFQALREMSW